MKRLEREGKERERKLDKGDEGRREKQGDKLRKCAME